MAKRWYRVDIVEGAKSHTLIGTSELDPPELIKQLGSGEFLTLNDLSYRDNQNRVLSWSVWEPRLASTAYINPRYITNVMPFVGDPRIDKAAAP